MIRRIALLLALALLASCGEEQLRAARPVLELAPVDVDFGGVLVHRAELREVQIRNTGSAPATVQLAEAPAGFRVEPEHLTVASGALERVQIAFVPEEERAYEGTVVFSASGASPLLVDVRGVGSLRALETEPALEFGQVPVGDSRTLPLDVASLADIDLGVALELTGTAAASFEVSDDGLALPPDGTGRIFVHFRPQARGHHDARLVLRPCASCEQVQVALHGEGMGEDAVVQPAELDFGTVLPGETVRRQILVTNRGDVGTWLVGAELLRGPGVPIRLVEQAWPAPVSGASTLVQLDFAPDTVGEWQATLRLVVAGKLVDVPVRGRAQLGLLRATPEGVDFGVVRQGERVRRTLVLENLGGEPITVDRLQLEAQNVPRFSLATPVAVPFEIGAEPVEIELEFLSNAAADAQTLLHVGVLGRPDASLAVPLRARAVDRASACGLAVPAEVAFGLVPVGGSERRSVVVRNDALASCWLWDFALEGGTAFRWIDLPDAPLELGPGQTLALGIEYAPTSIRLQGEQGALRFAELDASRPVVQIALRGASASLPLTLEPAALDFGDVTVGGTRVLPLRVRNDGRGTVAVAGVQAGAPFSLVGAPAFPLEIGAEEELTLFVGYAPTQPVASTAELEIRLAGIAEPLRVAMDGHGQGGACADCDRPVASCPASVSMRWPGEIVLPGRGLAPDGGAVACSWSEMSGTHGAIVQQPGCAASFRPDEPGTYSLALAVAGDGGTSLCVTEVVAEASPGITVQATWTAPADIDLHLFHPQLGVPTNAAAWRGGPLDCSYANRAPEWDAPGTADDPLLARDARTAPGAEQIRLDAPVPGHAYALGLHYFGTAQGEVPAGADVTIWCGGQQAAAFVHTLGAVYDAAHLGTVTWNADGTCEFAPASGRVRVVP